MDTEKWREETKLDELVPTWEFPEKAEMFKYYPQYYHKTDKVRYSFPLSRLFSPFLSFPLHPITRSHLPSPQTDNG